MRLATKNDCNGLSSSQDNNVSKGADTTNQIMTLAMARKRHERTEFADGFGAAGGCFVPDVPAAGLLVVNGVTG